ncbi:hypothetical protein [Rhodopirellula bahusiensis]|uniref:hypothetical protein n=1 Tax=Rhodopirellula bahusiensis TaxID=2014065 RepID=UPI00326570A5
MSGYFHERLATETSDPLFAKAMVIEQGETTVVWVVCDLVGITRDLYEVVSRKSESLHGIPAENHILSATHSHTAPDYKAHLVRHLRGELETDESESQDSPYATKLVIELSNCVETAYLPTHAAYAQGSYEVINSRTKPGSGEKLVAAALSLLRSAAADDAPAKYETLSELTAR